MYRNDVIYLSNVDHACFQYLHCTDEDQQTHCVLHLWAYLAALPTNPPECSHRVWCGNGREGCSGMLHGVITQMVYSPKQPGCLQLTELFGPYSLFSTVAEGCLCQYALIIIAQHLGVFQHLKLVFWALWHWQVVTDKWRVVGGTEVTNLELPRQS